MLVDGLLLFILKQRLENGFYDTLMMSGATKISFWLSYYVKDVLLYMIFGVVFYSGMNFFAEVPAGFLGLYGMLALT